MPILAIIIFGILSSCFALVFEITVLTLPLFSGDALFSLLPLNTTGAFGFGTFLALLGAALFEEISKYLFLRQYTFRYLENTLINTRNALMFGTLFGSGFASVELVLILNSSYPSAALPLIGIALLHILTSLLFTLYLFHYSLRRPLFALYPLLTAILLHMLYNMAIFLLS